MLEYKKYILAIGANDYRNCVGGTNKVILAHQELFRNNAISYFYICPIQKHSKFPEKNNLWEIIVDNKYYGVKNSINLLHLLENLDKKGFFLLEMQIHNISRVSLSKLDFLLSKITGNIKYYIHDYYTICTSATLMKNGGSYCGASKMSKVKCEGCTYYYKGKDRIDTISELFVKYEKRILFIAPSEVAKKEWLTAYQEYENRVKVIYHQIGEGVYQENDDCIFENQRLKVAYVGEKAIHKGWNAWQQIVRITTSMMKAWELYHFGLTDDVFDNVTRIKVDFRKDINAMSNKLRENKIHCAILWSTWPETYSYTYYECLSANTFILTNCNSGNICAQVEKNQNGIILNSNKELVELFENPDMLRGLINDYRKSKKIIIPKYLKENGAILQYISTKKVQFLTNERPHKFDGKEKLFNMLFVGKQIIYWLKRLR